MNEDFIETLLHRITDDAGVNAKYVSGWSNVHHKEMFAALTDENLKSLCLLARKQGEEEHLREIIEKTLDCVRKPERVTNEDVIKSFKSKKKAAQSALKAILEVDCSFSFNSKSSLTNEWVKKTVEAYLKQQNKRNGNITMQMRIDNMNRKIKEMEGEDYFSLLDFGQVSFFEVAKDELKLFISACDAGIKHFQKIQENSHPRKPDRLARGYVEAAVYIYQAFIGEDAQLTYTQNHLGGKASRFVAKLLEIWKVHPHDLTIYNHYNRMK